MNLQVYSKAIAAVVGSVVGAGLQHFGITPETPIGDVITVLIVAGIVYFAPKNKPA